MDCVTFHLLSVFQSNAAETQQFYISNGLKKPNRVPIRQFVQMVQQLNGYVDLLPCLLYSEGSIALPLLLRTQDQTNQGHGTVR